MGGSNETFHRQPEIKGIVIPYKEVAQGKLASSFKGMKKFEYPGSGWLGKRDY